jgi:SAM-dependent methyltransferase
MVQFKNAQESHDHSKEVLEVLYGYDSFLDSLEFIADFGCGYGLDTEWWAKLTTRDDPPEPRNYTVYAIDRDSSRVNKQITKLPNVHFFESDFDGDDPIVPRKIDFLWCHDAFQYVTNPLRTLKKWNEIMNVNGMLLMVFPQQIHYAYNRLQTHSYNYTYYNHNIVSLMYMLAVNGFDCRDAYFKKEENDPWLYAAVYKSDIEPMNPKSTSWYDLAEKNLLNDSVVDCLNRYGYVKQDELVVNWLDKDFSFPKE